MKSTTVDPGGFDRLQVRRRLIVTLTLVAIIAASFAYAPWSQTGPVLCPLRFTTGLPCPVCGLTRSFCACSQGDVQRAFEFHIYGPILFVICACAIPMVLIELLRRRRFEWAHRLLFSSRVAWVVALVLIAYHGLRLVEMICMGQVGPALSESAGGRAIRYIFNL